MHSNWAKTHRFRKKTARNRCVFAQFEHIFLLNSDCGWSTSVFFSSKSFQYTQNEMKQLISILELEIKQNVGSWFEVGSERFNKNCKLGMELPFVNSRRSKCLLQSSGNTQHLESFKLENCKFKLLKKYEKCNFEQTLQISDFRYKRLGKFSRIIPWNH